MKSFLGNIFNSALEANRPEALLESFFRHHPEKEPRRDGAPGYILAVGKAAEAMAAWLVDWFAVVQDNVIAVIPKPSKGSESYLINSISPIC